MVCVAGWGGMLYLGDLAERTDAGLKEIAGIRSGRLPGFFSTIMLLWAGQLALLIYWFRRKSRYDYNGRYRVWLYVGVTLQLLLAVVATQAHRPFSEYVLTGWPLQLPRYDVLCWLVPVAIICLTMFRLLGTEMRTSPSSRCLLWLAGIAAASSSVFLLADELLPERFRDLLMVGSSSLAHLGLATSLLMHARHVIHVSIEAPPVAPRRRLIRRLASHVTLPMVPGSVRGWSLWSRWRLPTLRGAVRAMLGGVRRPRFRMPRFSVPRLRWPRLRLIRLPKLPVMKKAAVERGPKPAQPAKAAVPGPALKPAAAAPPPTPEVRRPVTPQAPSRQPRAVSGSRGAQPAAAASPPRTQRIDPPQTPPGPKSIPASQPVSVRATVATARVPVRDEDEDDDDQDSGSSFGSGLSKKDRRRLRKLERSRERDQRADQ